MSQCLQNKYPQNAAHFSKRGHSYRAMNDFPRAAMDFEQSVRLDPLCMSHRIDLGEAKFKTGKRDEAQFSEEMQKYSVRLCIH